MKPNQSNTNTNTNNNNNSNSNSNLSIQKHNSKQIPDLTKRVSNNEYNQYKSDNRRVKSTDTNSEEFSDLNAFVQGSANTNMKKQLMKIDSKYAFCIIYECINYFVGEG